MSVVYVREKYASRDGSESSDSGRSYTKVVVVRTNNTADGKIVVCNHPLVPQWGSYYATATESDAGAMLVGRDADQTGPKNWEVTCQFSTKAGDPQENEPNPLARPVKHSWSGVVYDTYPPTDLAGRPFANSAHWIYDPPIPVPEVYGVLTMVRNEPIFDERRALNFSNVLNDSMWREYDAGAVKCLPPSGTEQFENGIRFVAVTYTFHICPAGWPEVDEKVIDHGPCELKKNEAGEVVGVALHKDMNGVTNTEDLPLDGMGNVLPIADRRAGRFRFNRFTKYRRKNLGELELE